jgi:hypothetical protein
MPPLRAFPDREVDTTEPVASAKTIRNGKKYFIGFLPELVGPQSVLSRNAKRSGPAGICFTAGKT